MNKLLEESELGQVMMGEVCPSMTCQRFRRRHWMLLMWVGVYLIVGGWGFHLCASDEGEESDGGGFSLPVGVDFLEGIDPDANLGVVLDVSGSMAPYLSFMVDQINERFEGCPIVFTRSLGFVEPTPQQVKSRRSNGIPEPSVEGVALIVPEEVKRSMEETIDGEKRTIGTPYSFLWSDLPKHAPQNSVGRLIEIFKTRPHSYMSGGNRISADSEHVIEFLIEQGVDAIYVLSDFTDPIDEKLASATGRALDRADIPLYIQSAKGSSDFFQVLEKKAVQKSDGRALKSLDSLVGEGE